MAPAFTAAALDDLTVLLRLQAINRALHTPHRVTHSAQRTTHNTAPRRHLVLVTHIRPGDPTDAQWDRLKDCEAGGNYKLRDPPYYGVYQFDLGTWADVDGTGNPADASPAEQDYRARKLYHERGRQPWPVCGKYLA